MNDTVKGRVALVTGGSSGLGRAAAARLVQEGATVYITGRRPAELIAAASSIGALAIVADISSSGDLERVANQMRSDAGRLDILVANAGVQAKQALGEITEEAIDQQLAINFKGTILTVQALLPLMSAGGSIVLVASATATKGLPDRTVYSATKAAIRSFARTWAFELKGRSIRVNSVSPGPVLTPGVQAGLPDQDATRAYEAMLSRAVPMGRAGTPDEIAQAIAFLASDASSFMTGADIQVDGGLAQV